MTESTIAFDLDGTLLDCRARQVALAAALVPGLPEQPFWDAKREGATTREALEWVGVHAATAATVAVRWTAEIEDDCWLRNDRPLPRALAALRRLHMAGQRLTVITARRRPEAVVAQVATLGLGELLGSVEVVDPRDAASAKAAVLRSQAPAAFVGDTESDASAAQAAGVRFLAVASGQRSAGWLRANGFGPAHTDVYSAALMLSE
jgi:phosphoglycolate phosphatase-like HAD superfamily hydrolase